MRRKPQGVGGFPEGFQWAVTPGRERAPPADGPHSAVPPEHPWVRPYNGRDAGQRVSPWPRGSSGAACSRCPPPPPQLMKGASAFLSQPSVQGSQGRPQRQPRGPKTSGNIRSVFRTETKFAFLAAGPETPRCYCLDAAPEALQEESGGNVRAG